MRGICRARDAEMKGLDAAMKKSQRSAPRELSRRAKPRPAKLPKNSENAGLGRKASDRWPCGALLVQKNP